MLSLLQDGVLALLLLLLLVLLLLVLVVTHSLPLSATMPSAVAKCRATHQGGQRRAGSAGTAVPPLVQVCMGHLHRSCRANFVCCPRPMAPGRGKRDLCSISTAAPLGDFFFPSFFPPAPSLAPGQPGYCSPPVPHPRPLFLAVELWLLWVLPPSRRPRRSRRTATSFNSPNDSPLPPPSQVFELANASQHPAHVFGAFGGKFVIRPPWL